MGYELKVMKLSELTPHPKNPRVHPDDMLKKLQRSIQEFGFTNPVLISEDNMVLAGHARCEAAERLGMAEVPCVVLPLKGLSADAYVIADNKLNELSVWDEAKLAELFKGFDIGDFDAELTGFSIDEIDALFAPKGCVEDDFDEAKAKKEVEAAGGAVTQTGDIWLLGNHRLMCGDSTSPTDFEALMSGQKAQLCVTSPPYGVGKEYEERGLEPWFETMKPTIKNICRYSEVACYNIGDLFSTASQFIEPTFAHSVAMFADNGFRPLWIRVWDKKRQALSNSAPYHLATNKPIGDAEWLGAFASEADENGESLVVLDDYGYIVAAAGHNYRFVKRLTRQERKDWGYSSMWRIASVQGTAKTKDRLDERNHKARFPVELPWRCIKMHSDKGGVVLEPFSGSGTTVIACEQTGRRCFAMERDATYCDIAVKRYTDFVGEDAEAVLVRGGREYTWEEARLLC
jgi:DNA modification methylase